MIRGNIMSNIILNNLAVIILNYNNAKLSLEAARNIVRLNLDIKVVIVDNYSTDNSKEILNNAQLNNIYVFFNDSNLGYAAGNNYGASLVFEKFSEVDTLCVMNPDIIVPNRNTIISLYEQINQSEDIGAITTEVILNGVYKNKRNQCAWKFFDKTTMLLQGGVLGRLFYKDLYYNSLPVNNEGLALVDVIQGCFFMIRKSDFLKIGGFDENTFLYYEEMILAKRLEKIGKKCAVLVGWHINHNHQEKDKSILELSKKYFDMKCYLDSRLYYLDKYLNGSKLYKIFARYILIIDYYIKKVILYPMLKNNCIRGIRNK